MPSVMCRIWYFSLCCSLQNLQSFRVCCVYVQESRPTLNRDTTVNGPAQTSELHISPNHRAPIQSPAQTSSTPTRLSAEQDARMLAVVCLVFFYIPQCMNCLDMIFLRMSASTILARSNQAQKIMHTLLPAAIATHIISQKRWTNPPMSRM